MLYTYLHLTLGHAERVGESSALRSGEVFGLFEGFLEREDLMSGERRSRVLLARRRRRMLKPDRRRLLKPGDRWHHSGRI